MILLCSVQTGILPGSERRVRALRRGTRHQTAQRKRRVQRDVRRKHDGGERPAHCVRWVLSRHILQAPKEAMQKQL